MGLSNRCLKSLIISHRNNFVKVGLSVLRKKRKQNSYLKCGVTNWSVTCVTPREM